MVAATPLADVTHQEAEHIESAVRHWLTNAREFTHAGLVDWLSTPDTVPADWQVLLDTAVQAAMPTDEGEGELNTASLDDVNPLPNVASFTPDEELVARFVVGAIHSGGTMFEGRLYECMLSRLLDADLPPRGVWPWDLRLRDHDDVSQRTRIEVRSGSKAVSIDGGRDAHVWVIVAKSPTGDPASSTWCVAANHQVASMRRLSTFLRQVRSGISESWVSPRRAC